MDTEKVGKRFWVKVDKSGACWVWKGGYGTKKYGNVTVDNVQHHPSRVAYILTHGDIPRDVLVRHTCDNPACCNPDHLIIGSHLDNMRDRRERARLATGDRNGAYTHPDRVVRGSRHGNSVLDDEKVRAIRREHSGGAKGTELARKYGVSSSVIYLIVKRQLWAHVE